MSSFDCFQMALPHARPWVLPWECPPPSAKPVAWGDTVCFVRGGAGQRTQAGGFLVQVADEWAGYLRGLHEALGQRWRNTTVWRCGFGPRRRPAKKTPRTA